jgi:hypothetical protein
MNNPNEIKLTAPAEVSDGGRCAVDAGFGIAPIYSTKPEVALVELIDGAYDIIEIWKAESPAQIAWKKAWMAKARELGAHPSW